MADASDAAHTQSQGDAKAISTESTSGEQQIKPGSPAPNTASGAPHDQVNDGQMEGVTGMCEISLPSCDEA